MITVWRDFTALFRSTLSVSSPCNPSQLSAVTLLVLFLTCRSLGLILNSLEFSSSPEELGNVTFFLLSVYLLTSSFDPFHNPLQLNVNSVRFYSPFVKNNWSCLLLNVCLGTNTVELTFFNWIFWLDPTAEQAVTTSVSHSFYDLFLPR